MTGNKADASTSTEDIKGRPLCLFYFTHPFGVLSPDPPTITSAPPEISQAFINMEPIPSFNLWGSTSDDSYKTTSSSGTKTKVAYELGLGKASISSKPHMNYADYHTNYVRKDSLSSNFSSDFGLKEKRYFPSTLPPLDLPIKAIEILSPKKSFWDISRPTQRLSLPPIEMPRIEVKRSVEEVFFGKVDGASECKSVKRCISRNGVRKSRRNMRKSGLRRMVTSLLQRVTNSRSKEHRGSPAIQEVLATIREAWVVPKSLQDRNRTVTATSSDRTAILDTAAMLNSRQHITDAFTPRPGASPGLMRRRYSMPEIIMRKYRLAQLRSDSEDSEPATAPSRASPASLSPARGSCASLCEPPTHRFMRRDREVMRKSALLRRLWGGGKQPLSSSNNELAPCACSCDCSDKDLFDSHREYERESRSLDGSRAELRLSSGSYSRQSRNRDSHPPAGWATPKRQRLDSPSGINSSDEMLRTAMRNSYDRAEEHRNERAKRDEHTSSDSTFQSHERDVSSVVTSDGSPFAETPESEETKPKKRRQSVCIYINALESPSADIKLETVTNTPDYTESLSISQPRTGEQIETSNSTYITSELTSTDAYSDNTGFETSTSNNVQYTDSLERKIGLSDEKYEDQDYSSIIEIECDPKISDESQSVAFLHKSPTKVTEYSTELLEIVVSETLNSSAFDNNKGIPEIKANPNNLLKSPTIHKTEAMLPQKEHVDIDEYVSNILVESLNSLSDQIEEMNASIGGGRKISIVEKEIKVKLQNTGMNTIVHLSPMSNNPIIFGNEELYDKQEPRQCISQRLYERGKSVERDNIKIELKDNIDLAISDSSGNVTHVSNNELQLNEDNQSIICNEDINKAVLQQIQKLFQGGLEQFDPKINYPGRMVPEISHIEISNVDVFIDDNSDPNYETNDRIEITTDRNSNFDRITSTENVSMTNNGLGEVGTGTYFKESPGPVLVPRFSAFPNTDSMEVNTSSSDDAEAIGSDCTSLVDSLDDPNSPRTLLLNQSYSNRRSELVRSAIDILDLLPDTTQRDDKSNKEKSEAFFIRIRDNECDCEKENIIVADHMPDKIKERLYRRHRKRELRMEYTKRKKVRQIKREIDKQRQFENVKTKKEIEKDCANILQSLIDDVITKIAAEEHKYMRIKQKSNKKSDQNISPVKKKSNDNRKVAELNMELIKNCNNGEVHFGNKDKEHKGSKQTNESNKSTERTHIRGQLLLRPRSPFTPDEYGPKRIYQKSEIHDGNKCIEILEILEYVESSQSSPDTTNSDENNTHSRKTRKSRIPIPIYERIHRIPRSKILQKPHKMLGRSSPNINMTEKLGNYKMDDLIANILIDAINDNVNDDAESSKENQQLPTRRASVPQQDSHRGRSSSTLRFKQMFDIIPEEKSSLSVESSNEDINYNRRISAPIFLTKHPESNNNITKINENTKSKKETLNKTSKLSKSTSMSPPNADDKNKIKNVTSPLRKTVSAATSPIIPPNGYDNELKYGLKQTNSAKKSLSSHGTRDGWVGFYKPNKQLLEDEGRYNSKEEKTFKVDSSINVQKSPYSTVRTIESENSEQIIINHEKYKEKPQIRDPKNKTEEYRNTNLKNKDTKRKKDKVKMEFFDNFKDDSKSKQGDEKTKRETRMVHSFSDPQTRNDYVIKKTDTKKIQMISLEKSEEEIHSKTLKLPNFKNNELERSSESDSDSAKSLLCSLAPKWLSMGNGARQKRQMRKKTSQEQQNQNAAGGWSVTVAGNCYTALPADVEMRLRFPKSTTHPTSQSDSGFGEDFKTRRSIAVAQEKCCLCRHCNDCTCPRRSSDDNFLPPAQNRKMTLMMKKESSGSSIRTSKSVKKPSDSLPEVESYKTRSKSKNTVKIPALKITILRKSSKSNMMSEDLAVTGCAIVPETKPRVPTMSERDLTRVYTPRHYLRS